MVFWWFIELVVCEYILSLWKPAVPFEIFVSIMVLISPAFIVACLVSFRSLWTNMRQENKKRKIQLERQRAMNLTQQTPDQIRSSNAMRPSSTIRNRWDRLLDTLADLEGTTLERNMPQHLPLTVPLGGFTVDFSQFYTMERPTFETKPLPLSHSSHGSSVNGYTASVHSECAREPQASVEECNLLQHAEPLPSYHRPDTTV